MGVDLADHVLQAHQAWAQKNAIPSAVLFVDLKSALYMVLRQAFISLPHDDQPFFHAMIALGLQPDDIAQMLQDASQDAIAGSLSNHLQYLLRE